MKSIAILLDAADQSTISGFTGGWHLQPQVDGTRGRPDRQRVAEMCGKVDESVCRVSSTNQKNSYDRHGKGWIRRASENKQTRTLIF